MAMTCSPAYAAEPLGAVTHAELALARLLDSRGVHYSFPDLWPSPYYVYEFTGGGKTGAYLGLILRADRAVDALSVAPEQLAIRRLRRHLLASVEDETGLPSITALTTDGSLTAAFGTCAALSQQQAIVEAAEAWREIARYAIDLIERHTSGQHYVFAHHPPPHETSPCGVIGFAAPRIPRAPGRPVCSPVPSNFGVAA